MIKVKANKCILEIHSVCLKKAAKKWVECGKYMRKQKKAHSLTTWKWSYLSQNLTFLLVINCQIYLGRESQKKVFYHLKIILFPTFRS